MDEYEEKLYNANLKVVGELGASHLTLEVDDTDSDEAALRENADEMFNLALEILGEASTTIEAFNASASNFTDPIRFPIQDRGAITEQKWMDAAASLIYCYGVTKKWADAVESFKTERRRIIDEWEDNVNSVIKSTSNVLAGEQEAQYELMSTEELFSAIDHLGDQKRDRWLENYRNVSEFENAADDYGDLLREGMSYSNFQELTGVEGPLRWAAFNVLGFDEAPVPDIDLDSVDPVEHADQLDEYLGDDGAEPDSDFWEGIAVLAAIGSSHRGTYSSNNKDIRYLEDFFGRLDEISREEYPTISLSEYLIANGSLGSDALSPFSNGLLLLSDEHNGGGFEYLPEDIQNIALGPLDGDYPRDGAEERSEYYLPDFWRRDVNSFGQLMSYSDVDRAGGTEFSINLTSVLGEYMRRDDNFDIWGDAWPDRENTNEDNIASILDVATRNEEANHSVITGNGPYSHPNYNDPERILEGLWGYDWNSDNEGAVSGLTNWIQESAHSESGSDRTRAREASESIIEYLSDLSDSGLGGILRMNTEGDNSGRGFAEYNPEIAGDISGIFFTYIEDVSHGGYHESEEIEGDSSTRQGDALRVNSDDMTDFLQVFMANEEISQNIFSGGAEKEISLFYEASNAEDRSEVREAGERAGRMQRIIQEAFINEMEEREVDEEEYAAEALQKWRGGYAGAGIAASVGFGAVPVIGPMMAAGGGAVISTASIATEDQFVNFVESQEWHDQIDIPDISEDKSEISDAVDSIYEQQLDEDRVDPTVLGSYEADARLEDRINVYNDIFEENEIDDDSEDSFVRYYQKYRDHGREEE
ncbi:hypothetical protein RIF23_18515 [Lipingzhangella sp. LS1_29]|uniref:TPR repeat domain-containing protein n=1 Tax=Lipingzhangella rawalii TaxID=2055835 RepID=A0ABU2HAD6_9ACTN|nr:hypothetical protein [Lipingzhangella rawalii]MDS1272287.1 hypothetical protein [Lipingzhangella rawalii]